MLEGKPKLKKPQTSVNLDFQRSAPRILDTDKTTPTAIKKKRANVTKESSIDICREEAKQTSSYIQKASSKPRVLSRKQILTTENKPGITSLLDNKKKIKKFDLTETEKKIYGNRCPSGYTKQRVLGRGGCALVWLAEKNNGQLYAIKQFPKKQSSVSSSQVEIDIFETLN